MKKRKLIGFGAAGLVVLVAAAAVCFSQPSNAQSNLIMQNVEALTSGEAVKIPCNLADPSSCTFDAVAPDGTTGTVTIPRMVKVQQ